MRLQLTSPKGEPSVKRHAVIYPILFLVVIPLALALALTLLFSYFQFSTMYSLSIGKNSERLSLEQQIVLIISSYIALFSSFPFIAIYMSKYGRFGGRKKTETRFFEREHSRIQINLYEVLNRLLFAEIAALIVIAILYLTFTITFSNSELVGESTPTWWPSIGDALIGLQVTLFFSLYAILYYLYPSYLKRDFRFVMAQKCMDVAKEEADKGEKINYLIAGLSSYNKYLKRNFDLQFDETRVASNIISSSSDKNQIAETIEKSFTEDSLDKLKPAGCLSTFANLEPKDQFLIDKKISTRIKEFATFLAVIIPVLIAVVQLAFPQFFPKP
jgi:hypothetical protein